MRVFETGATRDADTEKYDYEGFLSPLALESFGRYMHLHRIQTDGSLRDSDNWQKGIPPEQYIKSLLRHAVEAWKAHRGYRTAETLEDSLCAIIFNAQGRLHELRKAKLEQIVKAGAVSEV